MQHMGIPQTFRHHARAIHDGADAPDTAGSIDPADLFIARLLHRVDLIPAQQLDQKIVKKVRTGTHHDALRVYPHPPKIRQMLGNGSSQ